MLSAAQEKVLRYIVSVLRKNEIPFQITGGLAAVLYGSSRQLYDIDIDVRKKDILKVRDLFANDVMEDYHRLQDGVFDLYVVTLQREGVSVDISQLENAYVCGANGEKVPMDSDLSRTETVAWKEMTLPVQNKQDLLAYKKILGRDVDKADIQQIKK